MSLQDKRVILAPMEGVVDPLMRELLTSINDYDLVVTEFIRVVKGLVPRHVFKKLAPELLTDGKTKHGTPIRIQLLGQHPKWLAENANRAIELGSNGVDFNFGCPAKTVNKSKGGAVLLQDPELMYQILSTARGSVDPKHQISAKIRLGFDNTENFEEIIDAVSSSKVNSLAIHARTKKDGYKPPAYWEFIRYATQNTNLDIIANGEIWTKEDALLCQDKSGTTNLMLGRGALARPNLANVIKHGEKPMSFEELKSFLIKYSALEIEGDKSFYFSSRLKQWLRYLKLQYPEADKLFETIKRLTDKTALIDAISAA